MFCKVAQNVVVQNDLYATVLCIWYGVGSINRIFFYNIKYITGSMLICTVASDHVAIGKERS